MLNFIFEMLFGNKHIKPGYLGKLREGLCQSRRIRSTNERLHGDSRP